MLLHMVVEVAEEVAANNPLRLIIALTFLDLEPQVCPVSATAKVRFIVYVTSREADVRMSDLVHASLHLALE